MSKYPVNIDNDESLPRVFDNISETGTEAINALKEAIIAIEKTIGENPQGVTATLNTRISQAINDDGTLKASALIAAGLIALPITNSMISGTAAIEESKLDLDVATQTLQNQLNSHDIDITSLQQSLVNLLSSYSAHVNGMGDRHDGYHILLDSAYPYSTPPWFAGLTAIDVSQALAALRNKLFDHIDSSAVGVHLASNISVVDNFETVNATNVQSALEGLDQSRAVEFISHRDEMHANGISFWENEPDGYNLNLQLFPSTYGNVGTASVSSQTVLDIGVAAASLHIGEGDIVVIYGSNAGIYVIDDVGPRGSFGIKSPLSANQIELANELPVNTGSLQVQVFGKSSVQNLGANLAPTIYQADNLIVDSLQMCMPGAAKLVSLGADPKHITSSLPVIYLEVGVGPGLIRQVAIGNLHWDRNAGPATTVTLDTVVERINYVLQSNAAGNHFPVSAYRIGNEIIIAHNWADSRDYHLKLIDLGSGADEAYRYLGFDSEGANLFDIPVYPTTQTYFYVNGYRFNSPASILSANASVAGQTFTFSGVNPLLLGVKPGHLLHVKSGAATADLGTYLVLNVTATTIVVNRTASFVTDSSVTVEVLHDSVPLNDFNTNGEDLVVECFVTSQGKAAYNRRLSYPDTISNVSVVDVSDNTLATTLMLKADVSGSDISFTLGGITGVPKVVPSTYEGTVRVYAPSNIEYVDLKTTSPIGTGLTNITFFDHIDEEELFEVASVRIDGLLTASNVTDKRLYGFVGLDELREDVVQSFVELPQDELRSSGIIYGFDVIDGYALAPYPPYALNTYGITLRGGVAYVNGVRCVISTQTVWLPTITGMYYVCLNQNASYTVISESDFDLADILDGLAGEIIPICKAYYNGTSITYYQDLAFRINHIDDKLDLIVDYTNHQIGHFNNVEAAIQYLNSYADNEKFLVRIVSNTSNDLSISGLSREATFIIDGQIGNLTIGSSCKISSDTLRGRNDTHVTGTVSVLSSVSKVEFENLSLGQVSIVAESGGSGEYFFRNTTFSGSGTQTLLMNNASANYKRLSLDNCDFASSHAGLSVSTAGTGELSLSKCKFNGSNKTIALRAGFGTISQSVFDGVGIVFNATSASILNISDSEFKNFTTSSSTPSLISSTAGKVLISGTHFYNISRLSSATQPVLNLAGATGSDLVQGCIFKQVSLQGSVGDALLVKTDGKFDSNIIDGITVSGTTLRIADVESFTGNKILNDTGPIIAACQTATYNNGLNKVQSRTLSTGRRLYANNVFVFKSSVGDCITCSSDSSITNNAFTSLSATGVAITMANSSVSNVKITDNVFSGVSGTPYGIFLGGIGSTADSKVLVSNNVFDAVKPFLTNTAAINGLVVNNNYFGSNDSVIAIFTLRIGARCLFDGNFGSGIVIQGNVSDFIFSNNMFGDSADGYRISLQAPMSNFAVTGNIGRVEISATATDGAYSFNKGTFITSPASSLYRHDNVLFTGNSLTSQSDISGMSWYKSAVLSNIFNVTGTVTFSLEPNATSVIDSNIFNSDIVIDGNLENCSFSDNICAAASPKDITISNSMANSIVNQNFDFGIFCSSDIDNCFFSNNFASGKDLEVTSSTGIRQVAVDGNFFSNIKIACSSDKVSISNNTVFNHIDILSASGQATSSFTYSSIVNNIVYGNINLGASQGDSRTISQCTVNSNLVGSINIYTVGSPGLDAVTHIFTNNSISGNNVTEIVVCSASNTEYYNSSTFSGNTFSGNKISTMTFNGGGGAFTGGQVVQVNTVITSNVVGSLSFNGESSTDLVTISLNSIEDLLFASIFHSGLVISGNMITSSAMFDAEGISITTSLIASNIMPDIDFELRVTEAQMNSNNYNYLTLFGITFSSNILRSIAIYYDLLSGTSPAVTNTAALRISGLTVEGNVFVGASSAASWLPGLFIRTGPTNRTAAAADTYIRKLSFCDNIGIGVEVIGEDLTTYDVTSSVTIEHRSSCTDELFIENCAFSNNRVGNIDFIRGTSSGNTFAFYDCSIDGNAFIPKADVSSPMTFNGIRIVSQIVGNGKAASIWDGGNISNNFSDEDLILSSQDDGYLYLGGVYNIQSTVISANKMNSLNFRYDGLETDSKLQNCNISANHIAASASGSGTMGYIRLGRREITNVLVNNNYCLGIAADLTNDIYRSQIDNNFVGSNGVILSGLSSSSDFYESSFSSNIVTGQLSMSSYGRINRAPICENNISGTTIILSSLETANDRLHGNWFGGSVSVGSSANVIRLSLKDNDFVSGFTLTAADIVGTTVGGNYIAGTFTVPPNSVWDAGLGSGSPGRANKIYFNFAGSWTTSSGTLSAGTVPIEHLQVWGNTGNGASGVTFSGTGQTDTSGSNNISGTDADTN